MNREERQGESESWPQWLDRNRYSLGLVVFCVFFILYGCLVYTAGMRQLSAVEQASLAVIGVVVSAAFGVVLGIPFAARRIRVGSQLRRAHGISIALQTIQSDFMAAISRMKERGALDQTALAHLWEEVALNVRVSLRSPILDAERIIEDWGELAPAERERIRQEEKGRLQEIEALFAELETARSVKQDLEKASAGNSDVDLEAGINSIGRRILALEERLLSPGQAYIGGTARALMTGGHYAEAVGAYDKIVATNPEGYTNYIGRAKARFLSGDREGALADLDKAQKLKPDDPAIHKLRANFLAGDAPGIPASPYEADSEHTAGDLALSLGDATGAEEHYMRAETYGWSFIYSRINLAMSALLGGKLDNATAELNKFVPTEGTFVDLNTTALRAMVAIANGDDSSELQRSVKGKTKSLTHQDFSRSPLRHLQSGLRTKNPTLLREIECVFAILQNCN